MAYATTTYLAIAALAVATYSAVEADDNNRRSRNAQKKSASEQKAANAAQAAQERRAQIREERVRRARIIQAGENTNTVGSSGEAGALGSLSTQLGSNLGFNAGAIQRANNMSIFNQQAANYQGAAQRNQAIGSLSMSIFSAAGGINTTSVKAA